MKPRSSEYRGDPTKEDKPTKYRFKLENIKEAGRPVDVPADMELVTLIIGNQGVAGFMIPETLALQSTFDSQVVNIEITSGDMITRRTDIPERYKPCLIKFDLAKENKSEGFLVYLEQRHIDELRDNI